MRKKNSRNNQGCFAREKKNSRNNQGCFAREKKILVTIKGVLHEKKKSRNNQGSFAREKKFSCNARGDTPNRHIEFRCQRQKRAQRIGVSRVFINFAPHQSAYHIIDYEEVLCAMLGRAHFGSAATSRSKTHAQRRDRTDIHSKNHRGHAPHARHRPLCQHLERRQAHRGICV